MNKYKLEVNTDKTENLPEEINIIDFKLTINSNADEDININYEIDEPDINYEIDEPDININVLDNTITTNNKFIDTIKPNDKGTITGQITIKKANNTALLQVATNHIDYFIKNKDGNTKGVTIKFSGDNLIEDVIVTGYIKYEKPVINQDILIKNSNDDYNHGYQIRIYDSDITVREGSIKSNMTVSIEIDKDSQNYNTYNYSDETINLELKTNNYSDSLTNELTNFNHVMKERKDNYQINYTNNINFINLKKNITNYTNNKYDIKVNSREDSENNIINEILTDTELNPTQIDNIQKILLPHHLESTIYAKERDALHNILVNRKVTNDDITAIFSRIQTKIDADEKKKHGNSKNIK